MDKGRANDLGAINEVEDEVDPSQPIVAKPNAKTGGVDSDTDLSEGDDTADAPSPSRLCGAAKAAVRAKQPPASKARGTKKKDKAVVEDANDDADTIAVEPGNNDTRGTGKTLRGREGSVKHGGRGDVSDGLGGACIWTI
ncbi:hypothetical protein EJ02DRAFT_509044 [Clathrospora elynae]|uniref:Uncharacterized protein n=1 Tax=Clathrospora elynae TaxID=706981 RepID=A0A6A5T117_9PLEO|nr:hypothetical protein EJ02DRAFT_509044 [Clathrospora elynae]